MSLHSWLQNLRSALTSGRGKHRAASHRLNVEALEDRCVPALYAVTDLGSLGGGFTTPTDLNELGQVVGTAYTAAKEERAFVWDNGTMIDLGTLDGRSTRASAINDLGQVVGSSYVTGSGSHAFLVNPQAGTWFQDSDLDGRNDFMIDLGTLNGSFSSEAYDINNAGQVVGQSGSHAFLWDAERGMTDLGTPSGFTSSSAVGINESGQVVGGGDNTAFLWTPDSPNDVKGAFIDLGTMPNAIDSTATAINDAGEVVGYGSMPDNYWGFEGYFPQALRWDAGGGVASLGMLPLGLSSEAADINNAGMVVGGSYVDPWGMGDTFNNRPFVWDAANGMVNLLEQLAPSPDAQLLFCSEESSAVATNDFGAIVAHGHGSSADPGRAFLLTPIPPGTPSISIANAPPVTEGSAGTRTATFTVTLSAASNETITVAYATGSGTATADSDFVGASGTLTIPAGQTTGTITVPVKGDRLGEPNETFVVNLSNPTNATIADGQGVGSITDDEPRISISDVTKKEGNGKKTTLFTFTVTLSAAYDQPVTMSYSTVNGTATTSDSDYIAKTGTLTFAPGEMTKTITISVKGDSKREANETFYLDLFGLSGNALFTKNRGLGTILNDD